MNRTKEEFVDRWKRHVAGMALFGAASEARDGPLVRAGKVLEIPGQVEKLLGQMYDDLVPKPPPERLNGAPLKNGAAAHAPPKNGPA